MAMADTGKDIGKDVDLDGLFAQARADRPGLPGSLQAAILSDAAAVQAEWQAPAPERQARGGFWLQLRQAVGGWPALGGLAAASAAGLWIGFTGPDFLPDPLDLVTASAEEETVPYDSYDLAVLLAEDIE
jgi:hypothetical protein